MNMCSVDRRSFLVGSLGSVSGLSACGGGSGGSDAAAPVNAAPAPPPTQVEHVPEAGAAAATPIASPAAPATANLSGFAQFLTFDGGSGPNSMYWSEKLKLLWAHPQTGDWLDARLVTQGPQPYATTTLGLGVNSLDVTPLVRRWSVNLQNRGFYLRTSQEWPFKFTGRTHANAALRPALEITTDSGVVSVPCISTANWQPSSVYGKNSQESFSLARGAVLAALQFDLTQLKGRVVKAVLKLNCLELKYAGLLEVFELNPPTFRQGGDNQAPKLGLANQYMMDSGIASNPNVLFASDFSDLSRTRWQSGKAAPGYLQVSDASTGSTYLRGVIAKGELSGSDIEHNVVRGLPDGTPAEVETSLFARYMVYLEADWGSELSGNKMPGWDGRFGWWNEVGYWQSTTGNGGSRGSGLKVRNAAQNRWDYEGSSMRGLGGNAYKDGNPYDELFCLANYMYHLDQEIDFGDILYWPGVVIGKNRWHAIEQQIVMNTISGPFDANGNGVANRDGQYRVWVDGVLAFERTNLRWRRHPEMGIQGFWLDWYHGGTISAPRDMHFRMDAVVIAREYIGPRKNKV